MKRNCGRCIPPRWYHGSLKPSDDFGIEEDVFVDIINKKIYIKFQDETNTIRWQEILHNIEVLNPVETMENETIKKDITIPLYSDVETDFEKKVDNNIEYIENPKLRTWYKNIFIGYDINGNVMNTNIYFIEENSEEDLLIREINNINYKISGTIDNPQLNLIIDKTMNAQIFSVTDILRFNYSEYFVIANLQENGVVSGLVFKFDEIYKNDLWKTNHNFILKPKEIRIYNNHYKLREYKV